MASESTIYTPEKILQILSSDNRESEKVTSSPNKKSAKSPLPKWKVNEPLVYIVPRPDPTQTKEDSLGVKAYGTIVEGEDLVVDGWRWLHMEHNGVKAWMLIDGNAVKVPRMFLTLHWAPPPLEEEPVQRKTSKASPRPVAPVNRARIKQKSLGSVLPRIQRSSRCPGKLAYPKHLQKAASLDEIEVSRKPKLYVLVIIGEADSVLASWLATEQEAPMHVEVCCHEWAGHGVRSEEQLHSTLEEVGSDAFDTFKDAMSTGHFIMCGDSVGALVATHVCARALQELGVRPKSFFSIDRGPPHLPVFSDYGAMLVERDPIRWFSLWTPMLHNLHLQGKVSEAAVMKWATDMKINNETLEVGRYKFCCRVNVIVALLSNVFPPPDAPQSDKKWLTERKHITRTHMGYCYELQDHDDWNQWTDDLRIFEISAQHENVHRTPAFLRLLWNEVDRILERK